MTDYESIFRSQLEEMDFSGMEDILEAADLPGDYAELHVKKIISNMLSGDAAISQESVFAVIKALFFGELREFGVLAAELICICIIAGLLSSFTSGFGSGTASGMSSVICSFAAAGICMAQHFISSTSWNSVCLHDDADGSLSAGDFRRYGGFRRSRLSNGSELCHFSGCHGFFRFCKICTHAGGICLRDFYRSEQCRAPQLYREDGCLSPVCGTVRNGGGDHAVYRSQCDSGHDDEIGG